MACGQVQLISRGGCITPSVVISLCFNFGEFTIRLFKWKPFLVVSVCNSCCIAAWCSQLSMFS